MSGLSDLGSGLLPLGHRDPVEEARERAVRDQALLDRVVADMRLGIFREWLVDGITHVSALVPAVLDPEDGDRSTAMRLMRPTSLWPRGRARQRKHRLRWRSAWLAVALDGRPLASAEFCPHLYDVDRIGIRIFDSSVELVLGRGGSAFATRRGMGILRFPGLLPDAVMAACVGRPVEDVTDFPLIGGRGLVVERVATRSDHTLFAVNVEELAISAWPDAPVW